MFEANITDFMSPLISRGYPVKKYTNREMAPFAKPPNVKRNFQGASSLFVQKREISQKTC